MRSLPLTGVAWLLLLTTTYAQPEASVVELSSGCSGVCVSPSGLILTAEHCGSEDEIAVKFPDGKTFRAKLVHHPVKNGVDECQTYQIESASSFPHVKVAKASPVAGERVFSVGYPFGNYQRNEGSIQRVGFTTGSDKRFQVKLADALVADWQTDGGNSGGPMFNSADEVVGLASMSSKKEPKSYWIGITSIKQAMSKATASPPGDRRLVMFSRKGCSACGMYEADAKRNGIPVLVVKEESANFAEWKQSYERHTGKVLDFYPTFWVEATAESREEDYEPGLLQRIAGWFANTVKGIISTFIGQQRTAQPEAELPRPMASSPPEFDGPPTPTEAFDPANITIVILAKMQDAGALKGVGIKLAIGKAEGPLMRAINEKIGAKATLILIPQRTKPEKFAAVTAAARITADPAAVLILVKKQSLGLKGLIAGKVESVLTGKVPDSVPVELIFDRVHPNDFETISRAVLTMETQAFKRSTVSVQPTVTEEGIVAKLMPMLTTKIGDKLAASDNELLSKLGDKLTPETPPPKDDGTPRPSEQGIMGGLGLLVAERLRSMWIKRKANKAIVEAEASPSEVAA